MMQPLRHVPIYLTKIALVPGHHTLLVATAAMNQYNPNTPRAAQECAGPTTGLQIPGTTPAEKTSLAIPANLPVNSNDKAEKPPPKKRVPKIKASSYVAVAQTITDTKNGPYQTLEKQHRVAWEKVREELIATGALGENVGDVRNACDQLIGHHDVSQYLPTPVSIHQQQFRSLEQNPL
jgi:hypothetical protein